MNLRPWREESGRKGDALLALNSKPEKKKESSSPKDSVRGGKIEGRKEEKRWVYLSISSDGSKGEKKRPAVMNREARESAGETPDVPRANRTCVKNQCFV